MDDASRGRRSDEKKKKKAISHRSTNRSYFYAARASNNRMIYYWQRRKYIRFDRFLCTIDPDPDFGLWSESTTPSTRRISREREKKKKKKEKKGKKRRGSKRNQLWCSLFGECAGIRRRTSRTRHPRGDRPHNRYNTVYIQRSST